MKHPDKKVLLEMFSTMTKIRVFESELQKFFAAGKIPGFVHLYLGEEAVATGACAALKQTDMITSTHRGHGHCLAKGGDLKLMMAEIYGRSTGYCKGKGGSFPAGGTPNREGRRLLCHNIYARQNYRKYPEKFVNKIEKFS